ncbi:hypothetical protein HKX48_001026 [Thoreauomyces humboldtii]|nr:hypothetical protein HKX48_001026 [Thoreauomyces humboldtii]
MGRIIGAVAQTIASSAGNNASSVKYNSNSTSYTNGQLPVSNYNIPQTFSNQGGQQSSGHVPQQTVVHGLGTSLASGFPSDLPPALYSLVPDWPRFLGELQSASSRHASHQQNAWNEAQNVLRAWNPQYFGPRGLHVDLAGEPGHASNFSNNLGNNLMGNDDYGRRRGRKHGPGIIHTVIGLAFQSSAGSGTQPELVITRTQQQQQSGGQQSYGVPQQGYPQQYPSGQQSYGIPQQGYPQQLQSGQQSYGVAQQGYPQQLQSGQQSYGVPQQGYGTASPPPYVPMTGMGH